MGTLPPGEKLKIERSAPVKKSTVKLKCALTKAKSIIEVIKSTSKLTLQTVIEHYTFWLTKMEQISRLFSHINMRIVAIFGSQWVPTMSA